MIFFSLDITHLLTTAGYVGLFLIVTAESGMGIGLFLPGDSLLVTAGILASRGLFNIYLVSLLSFIGAVIGDSIGYAIGARYGTRLFSKKNGLLFTKENLERSEHFYAVHGKKTIIIARFLPVIRSFAPILAGVGNMPYSTFVTYNVIGAVAWGVGLPFAGLFLGNKVSGIDKYIIPIILAIVIVSALPGILKLVHIWIKRRSRTDHRTG